jgi:hypothetical protein
MANAALKAQPTSAPMMPEFQFTLNYDKDTSKEPYALVRHIASGKIYDSRDCPPIETDPKMCQQLLQAFWFMWTDQGKPETDFHMDASDGPNY